MKKVVLFIILVFSELFLFSQEQPTQLAKRVISTIDSTYTPELVLKQEFIVNVALDSVWNAYTTQKGFESWATSIAEIDFKVNGTIKTNYNKKGEIGDNSTIILHIINYVPKHILTLQAEITKNFPQFMKEDEKDLYNTILFEEITPTTTKVISYGIGYKHTPKYMSLMNFFIKGNEKSYLNLISYLETGKPSVNY